MDAIGLGTLLRLIIARLDDDVQEVYAGLGVQFRPRYYPIVAKLHRDGPAGVSDLARATLVSQPAATQTLRELKRAGLVSVHAGKDRRERVATLTAAGSQLAGQLEPAWEAIARAADGLNPGMRSTIEFALVALDQRRFLDRVTAQLRHA